MKRVLPYLIVTLVAFLFIGAIGYLKVANNSDSEKKSTERYFDENAKALYFYSDDCSFCKKQKPILEELADEGFRVRPMNVKTDPKATEEAEKYNISGTPHFYSTVDGSSLAGFQEKDVLREWLKKNQ